LLPSVPAPTIPRGTKPGKFPERSLKAD